MPKRRLSWKLAGVVTLGIAIVHSIAGYLRVEREVALFESDMRRDHAAVAHALSVSAVSTAQRAGRREAVRLIEDADLETDHAEIRWVETPRPGDRGTGTSSRIVRRDGARQLVTTRRLTLGGDVGILEITEPLTAEDAYVRNTVVRSALTTLYLVLLCFAILAAAGWYFVQRPMKALLAKVERIGDGDLSGPLALKQRDELGTLAGSLDMMCEELQELEAAREREAQAKVAALEQLRHAERLSTVGKLASGIAHELGTPLNVVSLKAKTIARKQSTGDVAVKDAEVIVAQTERMAGIIRQLLDFARRRKPQRAREDLGRICRETSDILGSLAKKNGVTLAMTSEVEDATAEVDAAQIQQVLTNLVMNAIQAQPEGGAIQITVREDPSGQGRLRIVVEDEGPGMSEEVRLQVFEPFFTTKDVGAGTGLGLSVAYGIVTEHEGTIEVDSKPGSGTRFLIDLPRRTG